MCHFKKVVDIQKNVFDVLGFPEKLIIFFEQLALSILSLFEVVVDIRSFTK